MTNWLLWPNWFCVKEVSLLHSMNVDISLSCHYLSTQPGLWFIPICGVIYKINRPKCKEETSRYVGTCLNMPYHIKLKDMLLRWVFITIDKVLRVHHRKNFQTCPMVNLLNLIYWYHIKLFYSSLLSIENYPEFNDILCMTRNTN